MIGNLLLSQRPKKIPFLNSEDQNRLIAEKVRRLQEIARKANLKKKLSDADLEFIGARTEPAAPILDRTYDSIKAAAAALGIKPRLLRRAKDAGAPGFEASRVRTRELVPWLLVWLYEQHPLSEADRIERDIKAENLRRRRKQNDVLDSKFFPRGDVERGAVQMASHFVNALDALPAELAPDLAACGGNIPDVEAKLRAALERTKLTLHAQPWNKATPAI
jgi:hypothetical protein